MAAGGRDGGVKVGQRSFRNGCYDGQGRVGNTECFKVKNGEQLCGDRKRKFSPIVWDREDGKLKRNFSAENTQSSSTDCLKKFSGPSPNICSDGGVGPYPVTSRQPQESRGSSAESCLSHVSSESGLSESRDYESDANKKDELETMVEEHLGKDYSLRRSRWASEDEPSGDCHHPDDEVLLEQQETPECGEFLRDGSLGKRARSSGSDEDSCLSQPAYGSDNDFMDIEEDSAGVDRMVYDSDDGQDVQDCSISPRGKINMLQGCKSVFEYERLNKINEGAYGVVYRARDKNTGEIMALKKVKMGREAEREGFPLSSLREINILMSFDHPSVVDVKGVVTDQDDGIFMVMEYMEHDLKGVMEKMKQPFSTSEVKCLMKQLLEGVKYLHDNWVIHRDLKTSNLLLNNRGDLKICDFGLSRQYGSPLKPYTSLVVTLWYRAPELLLGERQYSTSIDMWSVGCIMAELLAKKPLFQGESEIDQLARIFRTLGSPSEAIWPGFSELPGAKANFVKQPYNMLRKIFPATSFTGSPVLSDSGFDLLNKLLTYDPDKRITAEAALDHEWFHEVPLPKSRDFMPTFPVQNGQDRHVQRLVKCPDLVEDGMEEELLEGHLLEIVLQMWSQILYICIIHLNSGLSLADGERCYLMTVTAVNNLGHLTLLMCSLAGIECL